MVPRAPVVRDKPPVERRAGTRLTPGAKLAVYSSASGRPRQHGTLDLAQRLYQGGGERGNFIFRRRGLVTLALDVWERIRGAVDTIELIDHTSNRCYRIPAAYCRRHGGEVYTAGSGQLIDHLLNVRLPAGQVLAERRAPARATGAAGPAAMAAEDEAEWRRCSSAVASGKSLMAMRDSPDDRRPTIALSCPCQSHLMYPWPPRPPGAIRVYQWPPQPLPGGRKLHAASASRVHGARSALRPSHRL
jgi:hypothetical protein